MPSARTEPEDPSLPLNRPNTLPPFGWAPDLKQTSIIVTAGPQIKDLSLNAHISFIFNSLQIGDYFLGILDTV